MKYRIIQESSDIEIEQFYYATFNLVALQQSAHIPSWAAANSAACMMEPSFSLTLLMGWLHRAQIGIRSCTAKTGICLELTHEQQHPASFFPVMDVALPGGRVFGGGALALPVEQAFVDGIILVCLVQGHKEYVQLLFRQPLHALADGSRLQKVQCYQQLVAGIGAVQVQRTIKAHIHRFVDKINAVILILQKCLQLPQQNGTV